MGVFDEIDNYRNPQVLEREKMDKKENSVSRRLIDSGLDIANQMLMASEFAIRASYRDRANDHEMLKQGQKHYALDQSVRLEHEMADVSARREAANARLDALNARVNSPSSPQNDMQFE